MKPEYATTIVINSLNYTKSSYDNFVTILKKYIHFKPYILYYIDLYPYINILFT
jgi:hypothetical protein